MKSNRYLVSGRVQGVNFRHFTSKTANALGLTGWVRNLADGRVEILAQGPDEIFVQFEEKIRRGPEFARVDQLEITSVAIDDTLADFQVRRDPFTS